MLRCLLQRLPPTAEKDTEEFIVKTERYTLVRNSMDHLFNMIDNLIKTEQSKPPIFGALSWIRVDPENMIEGKLVGYTACNVSTGAVLRKPEWTVFDAPDSENIHGPVSSFKFEALDHFVDLTALMADIRALLAHFEKHCAASCRGQHTCWR